MADKKFLSHDNEELPREKLIKYGRAQLKDYELFSILLDTGIKGKNVLELSKEILELTGGNLENLLLMELDYIKKINGLGDAKACKIIAVIEIAQRILNQKSDSLSQNLKYNSAEVCFNHLQPLFYGLFHEEFMVICLNQKLEKIRTIKIGEGGVSSVVVDPKKLFREILTTPKASSFIVAHNHPSGNLTPSVEDHNLTKKLSEGSKLLDLYLVDHLIITTSSYFSFREEGHL